MEAQVWTSLGPASITGANGPTGRVNALAVDPIDANHWLLGSAGGGVWESKDAGNSWTPLTDAQPTLATGSIAFAPSDPKVIYVGTGEGNYGPHTQAGLGILKSTDGGASWTLLGSSTFGGASIGRIRVDPRNPNTAVAAMSLGLTGRDGVGFSILFPPTFAIQRTTDGGLSWTPTLGGQDTSLEIDATNFNNQYATSSLPVTFGTAFSPVEPAPTGVYRSRDGGQSWSIVPGPWSTSRVGRIVLAMAPSDPNTLYASMQGADQHLLGLYRTNNAWAAFPTWIKVPTTGNWGGSELTDYCGHECTTRHIIAVDPLDPNTLYAGGLSLWRCDKCSDAPLWTNIGDSIHSGQRCLAWAGNRLIACTDGGVFSTTTRGAPWQAHNGGLSVVRFTSGSLHPTDPNSALAAAFDNGSLSWTGDPVWQGGPPYGGEAAVSLTQPNRNRMVSSGSRIFRSTNGGQSYTAADSGFDRTGYTEYMFLPVRKCPRNDDVFLSGVTRIQRSNNFFTGATPSWNSNGPQGDAISAIAFAESDATCSTYAYGTISGQVFRTADGGSTWANLDSARSLPNRTINSLAFDPTNPAVLYAALAGFDQSGLRPGHLFKTANALSAAPKWENVSPGPNLPFNVVALDPAQPKSVYVGTDAAVWYSPDGGKAWKFLGPAAGLPNVPVYDIKINPATGSIVAFTFGRGAWKLDWGTIPLTGPPLSLSPGPALTATAGSPVSLQLAAGANPPYTWSISNGALPPGLVLLSSGQIVGTPLSAGAYKFTVVVKAGGSQMASGTYSLIVGPSSATSVWNNIGPAPILESFNAAIKEYRDAGRVASIAVDPSDSAHWLVGFGNGGIWETRDSGTTFRPISDAAPTLATGSVAFAHSDPRIVYAGTGEATGIGFTHAGLGMLKSTDGGKTWAVLGEAAFARGAVRWLRVHPGNPNIVLATVSAGGFGRDSDGDVPGTPPFGIVRSINGGATWTRTLAGRATALEVDPTNFNNQYAAIGNIHVSNIVGDVPNGLYRSSDGGQTWVPITGPWGASTTSRATFGRIELAIAPSNPNVLYAGIAVPGSGAPLLGLFRTDNAWAANPSWIQVPTKDAGRGGYCGPENCAYSHVISVDPSDANTFFGGGSAVGLFRCTNCASSPVWTNVTQTQGVHADFHSMAWAGRRLIVGNDGGVWSSLDGGDSWQDHNATISTSMFFSGDLHPTDPEVMLGGLRDIDAPPLRLDGAWRSAGPRGWGEAEVALSTSRPNTDWMASQVWGSISKTVDGAKSITPADAGIDTTAAALTTPVRKCPANDDVFLTGTDRLYRSDNFFSSPAPTWIQNGPVGLPNRPLPTPATILEIAYLPSDTSCNTYVYGTRGGQVRLTRDGGKTWINADPSRNLPERPVNSLAFDPTNPNVLYAALSSFDSATPGKPGHVFKTINALGASPSWVNVSPAQDQPFNKVAVDPLNPQLIFAGSDVGLWRSNNGAATWVQQGLDKGFPPVPVNDIKINPSTGRTVVFTYGRGAYVLAPELISNSRSPANGATYIAGGLVPGSWAQVQGTNLAGYTRIWGDDDFAGLDGKLPNNLSGTEVRVNGVPSAVYFISPTQISFQVPDGIAGTATVQVFRDGVPSNTIRAEAPARSPGIFPAAVGGKNYAAAVFLDGKIAGDAAISPTFRKARPGDIVQLYATGLAPSPAGTFVSFQPVSDVTVRIGSVTVAADAAGLVSPGQFQINFKVPQEFATLPEGDYAITVQAGGISSPAAINSEPPAPVVIPIQH